MLGGDILARHARDLLERQLLGSWEENSTAENLAYIATCIFLVLFAGTMSGLTLGLMSMDIVELEVLRRSGSDTESRQAERIIPVIRDAHFLLVTLLLCNAVAMEALPIFLDKLVSEFVAIGVSVSAVLLMGEVIPQAVCTKYGLAIGSAMAVPVRILMLLTSPISFPIAKLLDWALGGEHASLFRRKQLKALVTLHSKDEGFGGRLTADEIQIITGALDLTRKTAYHAMTPLDKVFMLSAEQKLDDATVSAIMASKPFSRLPVYRGHNRQDVVGVILVKELLEYVKHFPDSPVSSMKIRQLPRLSADLPMYDLLKLFRVGRSHMALLTQPEPDSRASSVDGAEGPEWDAHHSQHAVRMGSNAGYYEMVSVPNRRPILSTLSTVHEQTTQHFASPTKAVPAERQVSSSLSRHTSRELPEAGEDARLLGSDFRTSSVNRLTPAGSVSNLSSSGKPRGLLSSLMRGLSMKSSGPESPAGGDPNTTPSPLAAGAAGHGVFWAPNVAPLPPTPTLIVPPTQPMLATLNSMTRSASRSGQGGSSNNLSAFQPYASTAFPDNQPGRSGGGPPGTPPVSSSGVGGPSGLPPAGPSSASSYRGLRKSASRQALAQQASNSTPPDGIAISVAEAQGTEGPEPTGLSGTSPGKASSRRSIRNLFSRKSDREASGTPGGAEIGPAEEHRSMRSSRKKGPRQSRRRRASTTPEALREAPDGAVVNEGEHSPKSHTNLSTAVQRLRSIQRAFRREKRGEAHGEGNGDHDVARSESSSSSSSSSSSTSGTHSSQDDLEDMLPVPMIAAPGEPIGIITIEDVIEELMGIEILDETDKYIDNEQSIPVNTKGLVADLPDHLRAMLSVAERAKFTVLGETRSSWFGMPSFMHGMTGTAHSSGQPATSVLADLAGSMFRSAFKGPGAGAGASGTAGGAGGGASGGADPVAAAAALAAHVRGSSREKLAGASPPKRQGDGVSGAAGSGSKDAVTGWVSVGGQEGRARSVIAQAVAKAASGDAAGKDKEDSDSGTFANWKLIERMKAAREGGGSSHSLTGASRSAPFNIMRGKDGAHAHPLHGSMGRSTGEKAPLLGGSIPSSAGGGMLGASMGTSMGAGGGGSPTHPLSASVLSKNSAPLL